MFSTAALKLERFPSKKSGRMRFSQECKYGDGGGSRLEVLFVSERLGSVTMMTMTQKIHLHPLASVTKPPTTGPRSTPRRFPMVYTAMARPRNSGGNISATAAGPIAIGAEPKQPARKRNPMSMFVSVAKAHHMVVARKNEMLTWMTGRRPYISLIGAKIKGPTMKD
jgi:hypothetical protein